MCEISPFQFVSEKRVWSNRRLRRYYMYVKSSCTAVVSYLDALYTDVIIIVGLMVIAPTFLTHHNMKKSHYKGMACPNNLQQSLGGVNAVFNAALKGPTVSSGDSSSI